MKNRSPLDKIDNSGAADLNAEKDEPSETSFITNISIDVPEKERSQLAGKQSTGGLRASSSRTTTTTLALDPRPYRRRERFYTIIISILSVTTLLLAGTLITVIHYSYPQSPVWRITIAGVETNRFALESRASEFMQTHTGSLVTIEPFSDRTALAELAEGRVQIAQTSFKLSDNEKQQLSNRLGRPIQEILAPRAALAIFVHKDNPVNTLTLAQLRAIYAGEITNWQLVGGPDLPISLFGGNYLMGSHQLFCDRVMGKTPVSKVMNTTKDLIEVVARVANSTGGIGYGDANHNFSGVRSLTLKVAEQSPAMAAFEQTELNDKYPLTYQNYWYTANSNEELLRLFIEKLRK